MAGRFHELPDLEDGHRRKLMVIVDESKDACGSVKPLDQRFYVWSGLGAVVEASTLASVAVVPLVAVAVVHGTDESGPTATSSTVLAACSSASAPRVLARPGAIRLPRSV